METHAGPKTVMLSFPVIRQFLASLWQGPFFTTSLWINEVLIPPKPC